LILTLAAALMDNTLAPGPPETRLDRILGIEAAKLEGQESVSISRPSRRSRRSSTGGRSSRA
jgi:hypothetical protein